MVVNDLITILKARCITSDIGLNKEIQYVFCSDCMKIAEEKASSDYAWINADVNIQAIDLASNKSLSCIVVPYNLQLSEDIIEYAISKNLPIISTAYTSFKVCSKIYEAYKERT